MVVVKVERGPLWVPKGGNVGRVLLVGGGCRLVVIGLFKKALTDDGTF